MKTTILLFLVAFSTKGLTQNNASLVTLNGIGNIKLGMTKAEVEKIIGQKINIATHSLEDSTGIDSVNVSFNGIAMTIIFNIQFYENKWDITLYSIYSNNPQLKTKSGIGIGDDKYKIISVYENYSLSIDPMQTEKPVSKYLITLHCDGSGTIIIFTINDNKIANMTVTYEHDLGD